VTRLLVVAWESPLFAMVTAGSRQIYDDKRLKVLSRKVSTPPRFITYKV